MPAGPEYSTKRGFTTYIVRQEYPGQWQLVVARKLLGIFRRPDEVHELGNYRAAVLVAWVEDGVGFSELHLEEPSGKRHLISVQLDNAEMRWFDSVLSEKAGLPLEWE